MELTDNKVFSKIFMWMFIGLAITFGVGYYVSCNANMLYNIFAKGYFILAIIELLVVIVLSMCINKLSPMAAKILFCAYAFLTGLTFSGIFVVYEITSIIYVFGITALIFLIFSLLGYYTNIDLTKIGIYLFMALIAIIIASIINIFVGSETLDLGITIVAILIFIGYVAYDINVIKRNLQFYNSENIAIYGALQLYLDFINLFIRLLKLFAKERN